MNSPESQEQRRQIKRGLITLRPQEATKYRVSIKASMSLNCVLNLAPLTVTVPGLLARFESCPPVFNYEIWASGDLAVR